MTTDAAQLIADVRREAVPRRHEQRASASDGIAVRAGGDDPGRLGGWGCCVSATSAQQDAENEKETGGSHSPDYKGIPEGGNLSRGLLIQTADVSIANAYPV